MEAILFPYIAFDFFLRKWYTYVTINLGSTSHFRRRLFCFQDKKGVTHGRVGLQPAKQKEREEFILKKLLSIFLLSVMLILALSITSFAATTHTVVKGDSLWKIAVRYSVGLSEIKAANPSIKNYDLIYPGQQINIPIIPSSVTAYETEVVRLVNEIREDNGLTPLTQDWQLSRVARYKSQDMMELGYFSHTSPTYGSPFEMMKSFGISYRSAGENIAKGYQTPKAVVDAWMNSPGHKANILNSSFTHIGVGYVQSGNYWTQMFIFK